MDGDPDGQGPFSSCFTECVSGAMGREGNGCAAAWPLSFAPLDAREATAIADDVVGACRATASRAAVAAIGFSGIDVWTGKDKNVEAAEVEGPAPDPIPPEDTLDVPSSWRSFASMRAILASVLSMRCQMDRYIDGGQGGSTPGAHVCVHASYFGRGG